MIFSDQTWRERASIKLADFQHWLKKGDASYITYSTIAGLTIWPLVEAAVKTGQWQTVLITFYSVVSGVGANLMAEQLQRWRDQAQKNEPISENDVIAWIGQNAANRTEARQAIDAIITHFEAIPQLRRATDGKDWQEIADSLRSELQKLGTLEAFSPIINSVVASGEHSVAVGGDVNAPILTGAQATYIAQQNLVQARSYEPAMLPPKLQAYLFSIYDLIRRYFNLEELRTLCFEVNVEFDDLPGDGLSVRVREFVYYFDRQQRIPELIKHLERLRPEIQWPVYYPIEDVTKTPFKGLDFFNEEDADLFFGREELTKQLVEYLNGHRFLAVVGASGSGKSSVVRAGIIPTLRHDKARYDSTRRPKDGKDWLIETITPSRNPLQELALALTKDLATVGETGVIEKELAADGNLNLYVRKLLERQNKTQLLVVVDQFEELFTLCENEPIRQVFVENLLKTAVSESSRLKVVIVLRADFYAHCDQYPILREAVSQNQIFIGAMSGIELRQAIEKPAIKEGWAFENGLVDIFLRDIGAEGDREPEPGALPLLSHALLETWRRHSQHVLTLQGYLAAGGVQGAIAETAETTYQSLSVEQQKLVRQLFYSLTAIVDGLYTRRRVYREDIQLRGVNEADLDETIQKLVESRLIITNIETQTNRQTIEVAHEALIRAWPRLQDWLEQDRDFLHWQQTILPLAHAWDRNGRDSRPPLQGGALVVAEEWLENRGEDISSSAIRDIITAAQKQRIREQRRRQQLFLGAIAATVIMALLALWGLTSSQRANEREADAVAAQSTAEAETERADANALEAEGQASLAATRQVEAENQADIAATRRVEAEAQAAIAESRYLAIEANRLSDADPDLAALLALESIQKAPNANAMTVFEQVDYWPRRVFESLRPIVSFGYLQRVSPSGKYSLIEKEEDISLWDMDRTVLLTTFKNPEGGDYLSRWSYSEPLYLTLVTETQIHIVRPESDIHHIIDIKTPIDLVTWHPAKSQFLMLDNAGKIQLWDAKEGTEISLEGMENRNVTCDEPAWADLIGAVYAFCSDGNVKVWDVETGKLMADLDISDSGMGRISLISDQQFLIALSDDGKLRAWFTSDWELGIWATYSPEFAPYRLQVSPNERHIVIESQENILRLIDLNEVNEQEISVQAAFSNIVWAPAGYHFILHEVLEDGEKLTLYFWRYDQWGEIYQEELPLKREIVSVKWNLSGNRFFIHSRSESNDYVKVIGDYSVFWDNTRELFDEMVFANRLTGNYTPGVVWNPDGQRFLTYAYEGNRIDIWNASDGTVWRTIIRDDEEIYHAQWALDGRAVFVFSYNHSVKLIDTTSGRIIATFFTGLDEGVSWIETEKRLVAGDYSAFGIWDLMQIHPQALVNGKISEVDVFKNNTRAFLEVESYTGGSSYQLWNTETMEQIARIRHVNGYINEGINDYAISDRLDLLISVDMIGGIRFWDTNNGNLLGSFYHETLDFFPRIILSQDETKAIVVGGGEYLYIWDLENLEEPAEEIKQAFHAENAFWARNDRYIVSYGAGSVAIWDTETLDIKSLMDDGPERVVKVILAGEDMEQALTFHLNGSVWLWDTSEAIGIAITEFPGVGPGVPNIEQEEWFPDISRLITRDRSNTVVIWNTENGAIVQSPLLNSIRFITVENSDTGDVKLIVLGNDGIARLHDVITGNLIAELTHAAEISSIRWNGVEIETRDSSGSLATWDPIDGHMINFYDHSQPFMGNTTVGSLDNFVYTYSSGIVKIWDRDSGRIMFQLTDDFSIPSVDINEDFIIAESIERVKVWDSRDFQEKAIINGDGSNIQFFDYDSKTDTVLVITADGLIRRYIIGKELLIKNVCNVVGFNIPWSHWQKYFPGQPYRRTCEEFDAHPSVPVTSDDT